MASIGHQHLIFIKPNSTSILKTLHQFPLKLATNLPTFPIPFSSRSPTVPAKTMIAVKANKKIHKNPLKKEVSVKVSAFQMCPKTSFVTLFLSKLESFFTKGGKE
jgi:hypothetical protein